MPWSEAEVGFRPLVADDLPLLHDWLGRDHVRAWWGDSGGLEQVAAEYLPAIEGADPTDLFAIVLGETPIGLVQTYLIADYPEWDALIDPGPGVAGLDIFLGEETLLGSGIGTHVIRAFVATVIFGRAETTACVADPDVRNAASIRAFEKAGFRRVGEFVDPEDGQLHTLVRMERPAE